VVVAGGGSAIMRDLVQEQFIFYTHMVVAFMICLLASLQFVQTGLYVCMCVRVRYMVLLLLVTMLRVRCVFFVHFVHMCT